MNGGKIFRQVCIVINYSKRNFSCFEKETKYFQMCETQMNLAWELQKPKTAIADKGTTVAHQLYNMQSVIIDIYEQTKKSKQPLNNISFC